MKNLMKLSLCLGTAFLFSCDSGDDSEEELTTITPPTELDDVAGDDGTDTSTSPGADQSLISQYQGQIFAQINELRTAEGLSALVLDTNLSVLALVHNDYMATANLGSSEIIISHDNFEDRAETVFSYGYTSVGENVAAERGYSSSEVSNYFVNAWNASEPHQENILGDFTHTGISVYVDTSSEIVYATQIFAKD